MSVFKIKKNKNFTIMSNYHLKDMKLSLKAKGLLSYMLSLPEDWDYSLKGLCAICKESKDSIRSALKELENFNYLKIEKTKNNKGYFEYNYLIYEIPNCTPDMDYPHMDEPDMENQPQINTNIKNTKKEIDKGDKTKSPFFIAENHNYLTLELINRKYIGKEDSQIFYYDKLFEELLDSGYEYKDLLCYIHYIVPRVLSRDYKDENDEVISNKFGYFKSSILASINKMDNYSEDLYAF